MRPWICAAVAAVLVPALAAANGRAPLTNGVFLRPGDAHSLYVRSTFGLLVSHDDGCSFRWVCERAIGYGGEFDPKYAIAVDGTIFATTFTGLRVSRDQGCTWTSATDDKPMGDPGRIAELWIDAIDIGPTGEVWVATAESARPNNVYRSTDNGLTFTPRNLDSPTIWWKSLRIARSNPARIYVTGYQVAGQAIAHLRVTNDGGATWTPRVLGPEVKYGATPLLYVAAVDPADPNDLFVTSVGANPPNGDRVYRSTDGGVTLVEALATVDPVRDLVFRTSGSVVVATLGGGTFELVGGAFVKLGETTPNSPDVHPPNLACLAEQPDGTLIGCGANWQPDYMAVGKGTSLLAFQKLFRFVELAGPLDCPTGTTSQVECDPQWPMLKQQFGATGPAATCGTVPDGQPIDGPPRPPKKSGCDATGGGGGSLLVLALAAAAPRRRRRRRRGHSASRQDG